MKSTRPTCVAFIGSVSILALPVQLPYFFIHNTSPACPTHWRIAMRKRILELMPVLACLTLVLATAGPAFATFPGRNGLIAFQAQATADAHIEIYTVRQNATTCVRSPTWMLTPSGRTGHRTVGRSSSRLTGPKLPSAASPS